MISNGLRTILVLMLMITGLAGCTKNPHASAPPLKNREVTTASNAPVKAATKIHWLGMRRITADTNANYFLKIWGLPQTSQLKAQVLDKLAESPWRGHETYTVTNPLPRELLRVLLNDLVQEEFFLVINHIEKGTGEFGLSVRLNAIQGETWRTNLAIILETLTGQRPKPIKNGWKLQTQNPPWTAGLVRTGEWLVVNLGGTNTTQDKDFITAQVATNTTSSNLQWLEAEFPAAKLLGMLFPESVVVQELTLPTVTLVASGDGENVKIRGELSFATSLPTELEQWNIPTNIIKEPVVSFSAIRGIQTVLTHFSSQANLENAPNQVCGWSYPGSPSYQTFIAAPWPEASNRIAPIVSGFADQGSAWLTTNGMGYLKAASQGNLLSWLEIPFLTPDLTTSKIGETEFLLGTFHPNRSSKAPEPHDLFEQLYNKSNTVYYAWEITQERIGGWIDIGQLLRIALHRPQLPPKSRSMNFLLAAAPMLGNCATAAYLKDAKRIEVVRKSSLGLTGLELHLLADWFESPEFPKGMFTLSPQARPIPRIKGTNSTPETGH